jgi:hypothetical protein
MMNPMSSETVMTDGRAEAYFTISYYFYQINTEWMNK